MIFPGLFSRIIHYFHQKVKKLAIKNPRNILIHPHFTIVLQKRNNCPKKNKVDKWKSQNNQINLSSFSTEKLFGKLKSKFLQKTFRRDLK